MLKLENIKKVYKVPSGDVHALKGINLNFRKSEFVSILGPSGCGKTTTLNIIGGLDKYTDGDLIINGVSTKEYKDAQWDAYRNHSIGFVFQAYNLIPHQTVLGNVELALTIGGIEKEEKTRRAKEALDKVGLKDYYYKKPNQLSGGQCQRVAIARALVTEPEILLADEPTGALDSETSVQIMELIKEIAKERLVIMVTHNPELAEEYSTRIVKFKDGLIVDDSNPYDGKEKVSKSKQPKISDDYKVIEKKKTKMSFLTAFRLSFQNLLSKSKRTVMIAVAGAIGIFGVTTVLSVSNGIQYFIDDMQADMLASSPITISESAVDFTALMGGMSTSQQVNFVRQNGWVNINSAIADLVQMGQDMQGVMVQNNIDEYFIRFLNQMPEEYRAMLDFDFGLDLSPNLFANFRVEDNSQGELMSLNAILNTYSIILEHAIENAEDDGMAFSQMLSMVGAPISQMIGNEETILSIYEFIGLESGSNIEMRIPQNKNEILIVVDENNAISDLTLAQLGILSQEEFLNVVFEALESENFDPELSRDQNRIEVEKLMNLTFTFFENNEIFTQTGDTSFDIAHRESQVDIDAGMELEVVGIVRLRDDVNHGFMNSGFFFHPELALHAIENSGDVAEVARTLIHPDLGEGFVAIPGVPNTGLWYELEVDFDGIYGPTQVVVGNTSMMSPFTRMTARNLGGVNTPSTISIFSTTIEEQDLVIAYLGLWNDYTQTIILAPEYEGGAPTILVGVDSPDYENARQQITYTNMLGIIMSMMAALVNIISWALIAFTSLSLIVSSVMIGIITYVSVVERVKEIGVIRSLGGRKGDVSRLFTAETFMIGTASGIIGVVAAWLISSLINLITVSANIGRMAVLSPSSALIMILLSVGLTVIAGLFPSRSAAKKDPVVALRSE